VCILVFVIYIFNYAWSNRYSDINLPVVLTCFTYRARRDALSAREMHKIHPRGSHCAAHAHVRSKRSTQKERGRGISHVYTNTHTHIHIHTHALPTHYRLVCFIFWVLTFEVFAFEVFTSDVFSKACKWNKQYRVHVAFHMCTSKLLRINKGLYKQHTVSHTSRFS